MFGFLFCGYNAILAQVDSVFYQLSDQIYFETDSLEGRQDSSIFIDIYTFEGKGLFVFYDSTLKILASEMRCEEDTCVQKTYYKNGQLSWDITYVNNNRTKEIGYCLNGQLKRNIVYYDKPFLVTNFYCNGNKMNEFTLNSVIPVGNYKAWYKNGQLKIDGFFDDKGNKIGVWKKYNEDGSLRK